MKRIHAFLIALALGIAVVAGTFAALRSQQLASERGAAHQLEPVRGAEPRARPCGEGDQGGAPPPAAGGPGGHVRPCRRHRAVIYRRPAPIVRVVHRHGGEHEASNLVTGGGFDD